MLKATSRPITIPKPDDQLLIVTDGLAKQNGLGATVHNARQQNSRFWIIQCKT